MAKRSHYGVNGEGMTVMYYNVEYGGYKKGILVSLRPPIIRDIETSEEYQTNNWYSI